VDCPHCNWPVVLAISEHPSVPIGGGPGTRKKIFTLFAIAAVAAIAAGAGVYFYMAKRAEPTPEPAPVPAAPSHAADNTSTSAPVAVEPEPPPDPWHGLKAGPIKLEKTGEGHLVYAVGKLHNTTDHQRFGVKVALDIFNEAGEKVGTATDYTPSIDPGKEWKFKAMVVDRTAKKARLVSVTEN
jgi:hypothetical protein